MRRIITLQIIGLVRLTVLSPNQGHVVRLYTNLFRRFTLFLCSLRNLKEMCIGIIYDADTSDYWYRIEGDISSVKAALRTVRLPLPIACVFDTAKNDFVELNTEYMRYRMELLEKTRNILHKHLQSEHRKIASSGTRTKTRKGRRHL